MALRGFQLDGGQDDLMISLFPSHLTSITLNMTKEKMIELPEKDAAALAMLTDLCAEQGLLKRVGLKHGDRPDGVTDETALL